MHVKYCTYKLFDCFDLCKLGKHEFSLEQKQLSLIKCSLVLHEGEMVKVCFCAEKIKWTFYCEFFLNFHTCNKHLCHPIKYVKNLEGKGGKKDKSCQNEIYVPP